MHTQEVWIMERAASLFTVQMICMKVCRMCVCLAVCPGSVARSVWLLAAPGTVAHKAPLSLEFSRQGCWRGLSFPTPGDLPDPGIEPTSLVSPALTGGFFTTVPPGKPLGMHPVGPSPEGFCGRRHLCWFGLTITILTLVVIWFNPGDSVRVFHLGPVDIRGFLDLGCLVHSRLFHIILDLYWLGNLVVAAKWEVPRYCQMFHVEGGEVSKLTLVENHWSIYKLALMKWCIRTIKH